MRAVWEEIVKVVAKEHLPDRCELPLVDAAYGLRLNRPRYMTQADVTEFVASRDLKRLSDAGLLLSNGEKRGRFYLASPAIRQLRDAVKDNALVPDPYELVKSVTRRQPVLPGLR